MLLIAFLITYAGVGGWRPGAWHCTSWLTCPWRAETKISPKDESIFAALQPLEREVEIEEWRLCKFSFVGMHDPARRVDVPSNLLALEMVTSPVLALAHDH